MCQYYPSLSCLIVNKDIQLYEFIKLVNILLSGLDLAFDNWPRFIFPIKLLFPIGPILVLCVTICCYLLYIGLYYLIQDFDHFYSLVNSEYIF